LADLAQIFLEEDIPDVITFQIWWRSVKAEGQILQLPIDFDGRPYNTLTLPCERVITMHPLFISLDLP